MTTGTLLRALCVSAAVVTACTHATAPNEEVLILEVASQRAMCAGQAAQLCLLVREVGEEEWTYFYDTIEGFDYEEGFRYTIRVARRTIQDPPADASSFSYRLLEVLSREAETENPNP